MDGKYISKTVKINRNIWKLTCNCVLDFKLHSEIDRLSVKVEIDTV